jgi:hypothetical protein
MSDIIYYKNDEKTFRISPPTVETKCPETKLEVKKMTEIEKTEGEIKVLQAKLELLKEMEKHKSPAEEAYKRVYGNYPDTGICNGMSYVWWDVFCKGYNASKEDYKVEEPKKEQKWDVVRESVKWCKEHREESVEDYLKPQTPDKIEENLREAFKKVQQTEEWKETQRKIDSNYDEMVKNPPEFLKFELGKTLEGLIEEWWCDVFTRNSDLSMEESIDCLVTMICYWLPKEQSAAGSQNVDTELLVDGFNDALTKIKSKLRNKK